jgi:hypothetical protein
MNLHTIRDSIQQFNELPTDFKLKTQDAVVNDMKFNISEQQSNPSPVFKNTDTTNSMQPIKEYRGNQYDLDQFKNKLSYMEYQKLNAKHKKQVAVKNNVELVNTIDELEAKLLENQFKKKWTKLDNYSKKVKLKEYTNELCVKKELSDDQSLLVYTQLEKLVLEKKLSKKTDIVYNETTGKIIEIPAMKKLVY